jgi:hypothetical protein
MVRALVPLLTDIRREFPFDVIDAEFFFPDGPAATELGAHFGVPVSIKARGADIHYWGTQAATAGQVIMAGKTAQGLLAVSAALKDDMVALGMPAERIRVHYTGVDLSLFKPLDRAATKAELGMTGPLIVTVGALIPRKRQHLVIDALARLPGTSLALIGKGEDADALTAQAAALGLADRVRLVPAGVVGRPGQCLGRSAGVRDADCHHRCRRRARVDRPSRSRPVDRTRSRRDCRCDQRCAGQSGRPAKSPGLCSAVYLGGKYGGAL